MDMLETWVRSKYPPVPHDEKWHRLKSRVCKKGEVLNPILLSKGGEIEVEQFGIIGALFKVRDKTFQKKGAYFYQCPLIEAREKGTGRFGEWLKNVKEYVHDILRSRLALTTITNQHLYKYCEAAGVPVAVDGVLYSVHIGKKEGEKT